MIRCAPSAKSSRNIRTPFNPPFMTPSKSGLPPFAVLPLALLAAAWSGTGASAQPAVEPAPITAPAPSPAPAPAAPVAAPPAAPAAAPILPRVQIQGGRLSDNEERRQSTAAKIVIGREEIERFGDSTLGEVLRRLPGVTVPGPAGRGGPPRMRGLGGGYTLSLIHI